MSVRYRLASADDAERCNDFGNEHREQKRSIEAWRWEFLDCVGAAVPFAVAEDRGQIIGTQAAIPITMLAGTQLLQSAKSEETLVHPDYRGRGIFEAMYSTLDDELINRNVQVVWGFTPATLPFTRVGFEVPLSTSQIVFPLTRAGAVALVSRAKASRAQSVLVQAGGGLAAAMLRTPRRVGAFRSSHHEREVQEATWSEDLSNLVREVCSGFSVATLRRDGEFMKWRIEQNPHASSTVLVLRHPGQVEGAAIVAVGEPGCAYVVDVVVSPGDTRGALALLGAACAWAEERSLGSLRMWSIGSDPISATVRRAAILAGGMPVARGMPMVLRVNKGFRSPAISDWYLTRLFTEGHMG